MDWLQTHTVTNCCCVRRYGVAGHIELLEIKLPRGRYKIGYSTIRKKADAFCKVVWRRPGHR